MATFIRALTFRSADIGRMAEIYRNITDLKRDAAKKEAERKEMADVVEQDSLVPIKGRRPHRLADVYVRPQVESKRIPGELEIHTNGIRYQTIRSDNSFSKCGHLSFSGRTQLTHMDDHQTSCLATSSTFSSSPAITS